MRVPKWLLPLTFASVLDTSEVRSDQLYKEQFGNYKVEVSGKPEKGKESLIDFAIEGPIFNIGCVIGGPDQHIDLGKPTTYGKYGEWKKYSGFDSDSIFAKYLPGYEKIKQIGEWIGNLFGEGIELPSWTDGAEHTGLITPPKSGFGLRQGAAGFKIVLPIKFHNFTELRFYCKIPRNIEIDTTIPIRFPELEPDVKYQILSISPDRNRLIYKDEDGSLWLTDVGLKDRKRIESKFDWCGREQGLGMVWNKECKYKAYLDKGVWLTDKQEARKVSDRNCDWIEWFGPNLVCGQGKRYLLKVEKKNCLDAERVSLKGIRIRHVGDEMLFEGDIPQWFGVKLGRKDGLVRKGHLQGVWSVRYEAGMNSYTDFIFAIDSFDPDNVPIHRYETRPIIAIRSDIDNKPQNEFVCREKLPRSEKEFEQLPDICRGPLGFTRFDRVDVADIDCNGQPEIFGITFSAGHGATIYQPFVYRYLNDQLELLFAKKIIARDGKMLLDGQEIAGLDFKIKGDKVVLGGIEYSIR